MRLLTKVHAFFQALLTVPSADHGNWETCRDCAERWRASGYRDTYCPRHQKR
jgi:hypothetical protein